MEKLFNELKKLDFLTNFEYDKRNDKIFFTIKNTNLKNYINKYDDKIVFSVRYKRIFGILLKVFKNENDLISFLKKEVNNLIYISNSFSNIEDFIKKNYDK